MEEQGKTKKSIANLICMIASSVTCVVFGIIVIVMLFEVHDVKRQLASQGEEIIALNKENESLNGDLAVLRIQLLNGDNDVDVSFSNGDEPGMTFHMVLNPSTRTLVFERVVGCIVPDNDCDSLNTYPAEWAVLNRLEYELVKKSYKEMETIIDKVAANDASSAEMSEFLEWTSALENLVRRKDGEIIVDDPTVDDWEEIKVQDFNGDGVVSEYEYAIYTLADIANYDLSESAE